MTQRSKTNLAMVRSTWLLYLVPVILVLSQGTAGPTHQRAQLQGSVFSSFEEVTDFLREWFSKLTSTKSNEDLAEDGRRQKRDLKPPVDFEVIAHEYLLNETQIYLMQFLGYAEYLNVTKKESLDQIYQREERRLSTMSTPELLHYLTSLSKTLSFGTSGSTININGQTFDLSHVGSWCCPF